MSYFCSDVRSAGNCKSRDFPASVKHILSDFETVQASVGDGFVLVSARDKDALSAFSNPDDVPDDLFGWGKGLVAADVDQEDIAAFMAPNWISLAASASDMDPVSASTGSARASARRGGSTAVIGEPPFVIDMAVDSCMIVLVMEMPIKRSKRNTLQNTDSDSEFTGRVSDRFDLNPSDTEWAPILPTGNLTQDDDIPLWLQEELDADVVSIPSSQVTHELEAAADGNKPRFVDHFPMPPRKVDITVVDASSNEVVDGEGSAVSSSISKAAPASRPMVRKLTGAFPSRPPLITPPKFNLPPRPVVKGKMLPGKLPSLAPTNKDQEMLARPSSAQTLTLFTQRRIRLSALPRRSSGEHRSA